MKKMAIVGYAFMIIFIILVLLNIYFLIKYQTSVETVLIPQPKI